MRWDDEYQGLDAGRLLIPIPAPKMVALQDLVWSIHTGERRSRPETSLQSFRLKKRQKTRSVLFCVQPRDRKPEVLQVVAATNANHRAPWRRVAVASIELHGARPAASGKQLWRGQRINANRLLTSFAKNHPILEIQKAVYLKIQ